MALLGHFFIAGAVASSHGSIVDPLGRVVARGGCYEPLAVSTVNLEYRVCHFDWHKEALRGIKKAYGGRVEVDTLQEEGFVMVQSADPRLPLARVLRRFPLEPYASYHARHMAAYAACRRRER
jgi:hypothetical protein